jgi:hypothetical protein
MSLLIDNTLRAHAQARVWAHDSRDVQTMREIAAAFRGND